MAEAPITPLFADELEARAPEEGTTTNAVAVDRVAVMRGVLLRAVTMSEGMTVSTDSATVEEPLAGATVAKGEPAVVVAVYVNEGNGAVMTEVRAEETL